VITSSPSEDHTYAGPTGTSPTNNGTRLASSPDEAFGEGSVSSAERYVIFVVYSKYIVTMNLESNIYMYY
jgi:hypothetical protein